MRFPGQEPDDASLTVSFEGTASFRYRERSNHTHGTIVVINLHEVYAKPA